MPPAARVAVVDDYVELLASLRAKLTRTGYVVTTHASASEFLRAPPLEPPCCVLLDVDLPEVSGLELQRRLLASSSAVPIIFMTGLRDVPTTIQAMKGGAVDFLLKPFADEVLLAAIQRAIDRSVQQAGIRSAIARARERLASLTPREREVCLLVADGLTSQEIADRLGTAKATISLHRANVMRKLEAQSVADVVRAVDLAKRDDVR